MSRRSYKRSKTQVDAPPVTVPQRVAHRVTLLPRILRIVLVAVFGLAVTLALSPLVDLIYSQYFFSMSTRILPSFISGGIGLASYAIGWWLMVGTVGERPIARIALLWYFGSGILAIVVVVFLIVRGVTLVNFLAGS